MLVVGDACRWRCLSLVIRIVNGKQFAQFLQHLLAFDLSGSLTLVLSARRNLRIFARHESCLLRADAPVFLSQPAGLAARDDADGPSLRSDRKAKANYYINARGSVAEMETQLEVGRRRKYASEISIRPIEALAVRVGQMLDRLIESTNEQRQP